MKKIELGICTTGGAILSTFAISTNDLLRTVVFAAIGAIISFLITSFMKWIFHKKQEK